MSLNPEPKNISELERFKRHLETILNPQFPDDVDLNKNFPKKEYFPPFKQNFDQADLEAIKTTASLILLLKGFSACKPDNVSPYNHDEVEKLLNLSYPQSISLLDSETREFLQSGMKLPNRVTTGLPDSQKVYLGEWNFQGLHGTCAAWALANGMRMQGEQISIDLMTELLNIATRCGLKDHTKHGLNIPMIEYTLAFNDTTNVDLLPTEKPLLSVSPKCQGYGYAPDQQDTPDYNRIVQFLNTIDLDSELLIDYLKKSNFKYTLKQRDPELELIPIRNNAQIIQSSLERSQPIYVLMKATEFMTGEKQEDASLHAVLIAGYRIEQGAMDLQIIDSSNGVYWVSLEHFNQAFHSSAGSHIVAKIFANTSLEQEFPLFTKHFQKEFLDSQNPDQV